MLSGPSQRPVLQCFPRGGRPLCRENSANHANALHLWCGESFMLGCLLVQKSPHLENGYFPLRKRLSFHKILGSKQSLKVTWVNVSGGEAIERKMMSREPTQLRASPQKLACRPQSEGPHPGGVQREKENVVR